MADSNEGRALKISVVLTTFNREALLRGAIDSLLAQTLNEEDYEIIVVDNNSTDATKTVVEDYISVSSHNIRYIFEPRQGLHNARNTGAKAAKAGILAYTDDDARCHEGWLEAHLAAYVDATIGCAGGKIIVKWDGDPPLWVLEFEHPLGKLDETLYGPTYRLLKPGDYIFGANFSIRRNILFEVGGFNADQVKDVLIGDAESGLWDRIHKRGIKMAWVPDALVWHMQSVSENATLPNLKRRFGNLGIADASTRFKEERWGSLGLLAASARSFSRAVKFKVIAVASRVRRSSFYYRSELESTYNLKKALFELSLALSKTKRELVLKERWLD